MKTGNFTTLVLLSGALVFPAYAEKVKFEQLPADMQAKIRAQTGSAVIEDIDRETRNGKTIYEVAFKKNGQHTEVQIEEGSMAPSVSNTETLDSRKITYGELPDGVKRTLNERVRV